MHWKQIGAVISSFKDDKASCPNSIPIKLHKIINSHISVSPFVLINQSFESGIFLDKLKIAHIIPNFKRITFLSFKLQTNILNFNLQ